MGVFFIYAENGVDNKVLLTAEQCLHTVEGLYILKQDAIYSKQNRNELITTNKNLVQELLVLVNLS